MVEKKTADGGGRWFWRDASGKPSEPVDLKSIRAKVVSGDVSAQTQVSRDGATWSLAMSHPELGFDCIVLELGDNLNVLGPFARDYVDRADVMSGVPKDGILFVRGGTVGEALPAPAAGATGAALVERVVEAEKAHRDSDKARRAAEAALAAKDLEFDAERQKLRGELSGMKAAELKLKAELDSLRGDLENKDAGERDRHDLEARLVDAETLLAAAKSAAHQAEEKAKAAAALVEDLKRKAVELEAAMAEAEKRLGDQDARTADMEKRLSEADARLDERESRCLDLEGRLSEARESLAAADKARDAAEARAGEQERKLDEARQTLSSFRESAIWLRGRLTDLAGEVGEKFYSSDETTPDETPDEPPPPAATAYAEVVFVEEKPVSPGPVKLRPAKPAPMPSPGNMAKLSAIENQLKREISTLGAATPSGPGGRDGLMGVFKRRK